MGKRVVMSSAAVAVVALAVGVINSAAGASGEQRQPRGLRVDAVVSEANLVDAAPAGASLGDQIVFSGPLLRDGRELGRQGAVCTTVSQARNEANCTATYAFADGQITAQALVKLGDLTPYAVAITGGTGRYEGAEGEVHVTPVSDTQGVLTFALRHGRH